MRSNLFWLSDEQWNRIEPICRQMYEVLIERMIGASLVASSTC